jgi:hypothetical protein
MNEFFQLYLVLILLSLYCAYKYPSNYVLQALWLFGGIWLGVITMNLTALESDISWQYPLFLMIFNTILNLMYLFQNLHKEK